MSKQSEREQRVEYLRNLKYKGIIKSHIKTLVSLGKFGEKDIEAATILIFEKTLEVADARERAHLEAAKREAQNHDKLVQKQLKKLDAGLFAVKPHLDKPFSDDPRWTPWTRFVEPRLRMLSQAVFNDREISELEAMGDLSPIKQEEQRHD